MCTRQSPRKVIWDIINTLFLKHMPSACPGGRPPNQLGGCTGWSKVKELRQSPLGQVLLNEKPPWFPPDITGIHVTQGAFLIFGDEILLIRVRVLKAWRSNIILSFIEQKSLQSKNTWKQISHQVSFSRCWFSLARLFFSARLFFFDTTFCFSWENARGDRPHIYTGMKPCANLLYFSSNEHVL